MHLETRRQFLHMSGVGVAFYIRWAHDTYGFFLAFATLAVSLLIGYAITRKYREGMHLPFISRFIELYERSEVIEEDPGKGALSFFVGSLAVLVLFRFNIGIVSASIMILALGDSVSTLVGRNFGRHKIFYNSEKSWEGTAAGFLFAFLGAATQIKLGIAFVGALTGMLFESFPLKVDDNIGVPLASGAAMSLALFF
ncbi:MAG: diacylglycerol/polyprenol kinase family protein [Candidatus Hydrothermarchaeales archaeon]